MPTQQPTKTNHDATACSESKVRSPRTHLWRGAKAVSPLLPGIIPFAMVAGSSAAEIGASAWSAMGLSLFIFAGASQLVFLDMWARETPALILLATVLLVNLRFTMYSATLAPYLRGLPWIRKIPLAYLMTDQATLVSLPEFEKQPNTARWFYLGTALTLWGPWQIGTWVGFFLGVKLPASWSLEFAVPLSFLAMLIPAIRNQATALAAFSAGGAVLFTRLLPLNLGLITATFIGVATGLLAESRRT